MSRPRLPAWLHTARARLTLTYSGVLFGITALVLLGVYVALSLTTTAEPLDPLTVKKFYRHSDGTIVYKPGEEFQVADLESVQRAVNYSTLQNLRGYSLVALVVIFVLSLVIGWLVAGRMLRPIGAMARTAREIEATDLSRRIAAVGPRDEFRELADTVDGMLDRLESAFDAERRLVEDVSHELRNPVAVVQANVEAVLGDESSTPEQRAEAREVVLGATARMSRLLEDLLATARARSDAFTERDVDLASLVGETAREYRVLAERRGLRIDESLNYGPTVFADPEALGRAVGNLLSNAVRLAPPGSAVRIAIGSRRGWAFVAVRDQGPGIPEERRATVFDRFVRDAHTGSADESGGRSARGTGLGLAIARQIVESHEGRIRLISRGDAGSTFVIWLPERAALSAGTRAGAVPDDDPTEG